MKTRILICCIFFMLMIFAGSAWAADGNASYSAEEWLVTGNYNTFIGDGTGGTVNTGAQNTFVGDEAGSHNTTGYNNTFLGTWSGLGNTTGYGNTFLGNETGYSHVSGLGNTFVGGKAGRSNTVSSANTFIGTSAGFNTNGTGVVGNTDSGNANTFIGAQAGYSNQTGAGNNFIGYQAGYTTTTGSGNTFIGLQAGYYSTGVGNNFIGYQAGYNTNSGGGNSFFGKQAGYNTNSGNGNSFFGDEAGDQNTVESVNTIIGFRSDIDNTTPGSVNNATAIGAYSYASAPNSLVLGSIAGVNGAASSVNVGIGTSAPARQLHLVGDNTVFRMDRTKNTAAFMMVRTDASGNPMKTFVVGTNASASGVGTFVINDLGASVSGSGTNRMTINNDGSVTFTGNVYANAFVPSSIAYKDNIRTYENALDTVSKLRGVKFDWKDSGKPSVGLIAEEVEKVVPEIVAHNESNATGVNYASLVGVLVEAVKEQQKQHQEQLKINSALAVKIEELERLLASK